MDKQFILASCFSLEKNHNMFSYKRRWIFWIILVDEVEVTVNLLVYFSMVEKVANIL